ncbi:superoxide dismutase family protein [Rubrivirga marina]|uniref:Superoxide dismutase [Cu-Zn] n=1 Tax=Rubrivirga marina TaxID=1196024 RepID=A0A271J4F6_9BACT|nr:superoxide dismutase family protein [Rubrivirga marina]PAP77569.1 hypothetical protein BSZ37_14520 [Rubrivirga marina]
MRVLLLSLPILLAACADAPEPIDTSGAGADTTLAPSPSGPDRAVARIAEVDGSGVVGAVEFVDLGDAVEVRYNLSGLSAGLHGFHVHQTGDCGPDSTGTPAGAAGEHFNPLASPHGAPSAAPAQRHAGDLGNVEPDASGRAIGVRVDSVLSFDGPTSILGKALLLHGGEDDLTSQPSGDAGPRVGCGVIEEAAAVGSLPDSLAVPTGSVEP